MQTLRERFFARIRKTPSCWEWLGKPGKPGYGFFGWEGKSLSAHRLSYQIHNGNIPKNLVVMHTCDNRICVNPEHLRLGTLQDNVRDMVIKGRTAKGEGHSQSKLTEKDVLEMRVLRKTGTSSQELSRRFSVHRTCVDKILRKKLWKHI